MSLSMWAWRVIFPGGGLAACVLVLWASIQGAARPEDGEGRAAATTPRGDRVVAEGRVVARPGAEVTVGTAAGGLVVDLPSGVKARVKKGDLVARLRATDEEAAQSQAEAKLAEAEAEFEFQKREFQRRAKAPLDSQRFAADVDSTRRDFEVASARRKAAAAALDQARSAVGQKRVTSPIDGVVLAWHVQPGEVVPPGARLVTVCDLSRTLVEAEVDEFDAGRVTVGSPVTITAEGSGTDRWAGTVEEVPDRVSGRTLRPDDPGRPTDTGVLLVKIAPTRPIPLRLGQQLEVEIHPVETIPRDKTHAPSAGPDGVTPPAAADVSLPRR